MALDLDKPYGWDGLTARRVLAELAGFERSAARYPEHPQWARPMDLGGGNGTSHSAVLTKLVRAGLVERKQRGGWGGIRGSWGYRLSEEARKHVQEQEQR